MELNIIAMYLKSKLEIGKCNTINMKNWEKVEWKFSYVNEIAHTINLKNNEVDFLEIAEEKRIITSYYRVSSNKASQTYMVT